MTETTVEEVFHGACSSVLNNYGLADLFYRAMQVLGPIEFTPEEEAYAQEINRDYPIENVRDQFDGVDLPEDLRERVTEFLQQSLLGENFPALDEGEMGTWSNDVGDVSWIAPLGMLSTTCFPSRVTVHTWGVAAATGRSIGHKGMMHAAKIMALAAMDLYTDPVCLARIQEEFQTAIQDHPYESPIPEHVEPPRYENPVRGVT